MKSKGLVYLGMSGGVDSSVSAALLLRAGYRVVGVFIKVWEPPGYKCTWRDDRREAMRVAASLDIPLLTLDLESEYKREVVDYMINEYRAGRTPNPDVMCNHAIKFGSFYDWALKQGANFVATGHYARIISGKLARAVDPNKDQSYFLWNLRPEQLGRLLFPIGHLSKPAVRALAKKFKLPNAEKKDSQGLCFIGQIDLKDFLGRYLKLEPGSVLNEQGQVIGDHDGAIIYTAGERHGFRIKQQSPTEQPYFIIARDLTQNTITVSHELNQPEFKTVILADQNWLGEVPKFGQLYQARIRHRGELYKCDLSPVDNLKIRLNFHESPLAPAAGQSVVLYDNEVCLGGGIITNPD